MCGKAANRVENQVDFLLDSQDRNSIVHIVTSLRAKDRESVIRFPKGQEICIPSVETDSAGHPTSLTVGAGLFDRG